MYHSNFCKHCKRIPPSRARCSYHHLLPLAFLISHFSGCVSLFYYASCLYPSCRHGEHFYELVSHSHVLVFKYLFKYFAHFIGLSVFCLLSYKTISFHFSSLLFYIHMKSFEEQKMFILMKFNCQYFKIYAFTNHLRNLFLPQGHKYVLLCILLEIVYF